MSHTKPYENTKKTKTKLKKREGDRKKEEWKDGVESGKEGKGARLSSVVWHNSPDVVFLMREPSHRAKTSPKPNEAGRIYLAVAVPTALFLTL